MTTKYTYGGCELIYTITNDNKAIVFPNTLQQINQAAFDLAEATFNTNLPESVTFIGRLALASNHIQRIKVGKNVRIICSGAFGYSRSDGVIEVDEGNPFFCIDGFGVLFDASKTRLIHVPTYITNYKIPPSVLFIDYSSFSETKINELIIPANVKTIGSEAFSWMPNLKKIIIQGNFDTYLNGFGKIFAGSRALTGVYYSGIKVLEGDQFDISDIKAHVCFGYKGTTFGGLNIIVQNECLAYPIVQFTCKNSFSAVINRIMLISVLVFIK